MCSWKWPNIKLEGRLANAGGLRNKRRKMAETMDDFDVLSSYWTLLLDPFFSRKLYLETTHKNFGGNVFTFSTFSTHVAVMQISWRWKSIINQHDCAAVNSVFSFSCSCFISPSHFPFIFCTGIFTLLSIVSPSSVGCCLPTNARL